MGPRPERVRRRARPPSNLTRDLPALPQRPAGEAAEATIQETALSDDQLQGTNREKDPDEWVTGEEPMTGAQASYLKTLSDQAGEEFDDSLTKAEASKRIDELQSRTGRGSGG
jgi:hypothetical protein